MIRVKFYFSSGREQSCHDCDTAKEAFERLQRTGMEALAWPVGALHGVYAWRPNQEHTLQHFAAVMGILERGRDEKLDADEVWQLKRELTK